MEDHHQFHDRLEAFFLIEVFQPRRDPFDGFSGKGDAVEGLFKEIPDKIHLIPFQEDFVKQVLVELDGDLQDLFTFAFMRKPGMGNIGPDQDQFDIVDLFYATPDDPPYTLGVFYKIKFVLLVIVYWKIKLRFMPGKQRETICLCKRGTLF
jgi:hypothetical protein